MFEFFVYFIGYVYVCWDKGEGDVLNSRFIEKWNKEVWGNIFYFICFWCLSKWFYK